MELKRICWYLFSLDSRLKSNEFVEPSLINDETKNRPTIGNIYLNKYLHILQMIHLGFYDKSFFKEEVICFLNGGVILEAWLNWEIWVNENITKEKLNEIKNHYKEEVKFLEKFIKIFKKRTLFSLIKTSHLDPAWLLNVNSINLNKLKNKMDMKKYQKEYKEIFEFSWK